MSAQFTLLWSNADALASSNATAFRALYRYKTVGGSFLSTGFTPANNMVKSVTTTDSPALNDNVVIEFKLQTICTVSGPTDNDNGVQEQISFVCIAPTLTNAYNQSQLVLDLTGTDITKARLTLRKSSDNSIILAATTVNRSGTTITYTKTGLTGSTSYYWQVELIANVNSVDVYSSSLEYKGLPCSPYSFTTDAAPGCSPITAITVTSIEIP
jgi:hypothetical protein